jgi:hypothetical protein
VYLQTLLHHVITQSSPSLSQSAALALLFGPERQQYIVDPTGRSPFPSSSIDVNHIPFSPLSLHIVALENTISSVKDLQRQLSSSSPSCLDQFVLLRDLQSHVFQVASLIALSPVPALSFAIVDTTRLLAAIVHLAAIEETGSIVLSEDDIMHTATHLFGALASSYSGMREVMIAFENANLEHIWFSCFVGQLSSDGSLVSELRRAPGILSVVEEACSASRNADIHANWGLSRVQLGIMSFSLIDCWRSCQTILQRRLWDFDEVRRHSDEIHHASVQLAKSCAYESGREVASHFFFTYVK